jgi:hypothetical protein
MLLLLALACAQEPGRNMTDAQPAPDTRSGSTGSMDAPVPVADAATPDASAPADADVMVEAGSPADASVPVDASAAPEAGLPDASPPVPSPDAGSPDSQPDTAPAESGAVIWQVYTGASSYGLALDPAGNIVLGGTIVPAAQSDFLIARYSPDGTPLMSKQFGGPQNQYLSAIKVAADGTVVMTGSFEGATDFGGQMKTAVGEYDLFVASYTPELTLKNVVTFGGPFLDEGYGLVVDDASSDWIVSGYGGPFSIGTTMVETTFLFRVAPTGAVRWARPEGGSTVIELTKGGTLVATGAGDDLSGTSAHARGNGMPSWNRSIGAGVSGYGLATDRQGRVLVTGTFYETLSVRGQNVRSRGEADLFVMAVAAATGQVIWADVVAGSQGAEVGQAVCGDRAGNIYVGGVYAGSAAITPGEAAAPMKSILAKYNENGTRQWAKILPSPAAGVQSLICDAPGGLVVGLYGAVAKVVP